MSTRMRRLGSMRIRIQEGSDYADPDPKHWFQAAPAS